MSTVDDFLKKLKSDDSAERKQGIIGLAKSNDQSAAYALEAVQKSDPDPALRELAGKALQRIQGGPASSAKSGNLPAPGFDQLEDDSRFDWSMDQIGNFVFEILLWFAIIAVLFAVLMLASINDDTWQEVIRSAQQEGASADQIAFYRDAADFWERSGPGASILIGLGLSGVITVVAFVMSIFIWIVGMMIGGTGDLFRFITIMFRANAGLYVLSVGFTAIGSLFPETSAATSALSSLSTIGGWLLIGWAIGKGHEFGMLKGCGTMALAAFVCVGGTICFIFTTMF